MDWTLFSARVGESWREARKILDRGFRPSATISFRQTMQDHTRGFLARLLATPQKFRSHANQSGASLPCIVLSLTTT